MGRRRSPSPPAAAAGLGGRLDVLNHPRVGAVLRPAAQQLDHSLEGPLGGADALDGGDLALDGEDRLDLQRRAQPRWAPAIRPPAQALQGVDREPHLQRGSPGELARAPRRRSHRRGRRLRRLRRLRRPGSPCPRRRRWLNRTRTRSRRAHRVLELYGAAPIDSASIYAVGADCMQKLSPQVSDDA